MTFQTFASDRSEPFNAIRTFLNDAKSEVVIFSPYVKVSALEQFSFPKNAKVTLITTYKLEDLWAGSSDIELYPYCSQNSIKLFINNSIHLKTYIRDWESLVFGSSNLSKKGLALVDSYSLELNGLVPYLDVKLLIYLRRILAQSYLMDHVSFGRIKQRFDDLPDRIRIEDMDFSDDQREKQYLISSLPMSADIKRLHEIICAEFKNGTPEEINCAIHDYILYALPQRLEFDEFIIGLKEEFFASPFIQDLLSFIDREERYFGAVKEWIHSKCADVPVPSRRDLTGNIQVLYRWIEFLSNGRYIVDRPRHSERIYRATE